jgi:hypothetical protein
LKKIPLIKLLESPEKFWDKGVIEGVREDIEKSYAK